MNPSDIDLAIVAVRSFHPMRRLRAAARRFAIRIRPPHDAQNGVGNEEKLAAAFVPRT